LLTNLVFDVATEDQLMSSILDDKMQPDEAGKAWMKKNSDVVARWLDGVTTIDGKPGLEAVKSKVGL